MISAGAADGSNQGLGRRLDEIAANATPAPQTQVMKGWLCKQAPDLPFRRANAVLPPMGAGQDPLEAAQALSEIEDWYGAAQQRVLIQVSSADPAADDLDGLLAERGYTVEAPVDLMVGDPKEVAAQSQLREERRADDNRTVPTTGAPAPQPDDRPGVACWAGFEVTLVNATEHLWALQSAQAQGADARSNDRIAGYQRMLRPLDHRASWATASVAATGPGVPGACSDVIGVGFAVAEQGWSGLFGMVTSPQWRSRGVAATIVRAIAGQAAAHDRVDGLYLQVEIDNAPAQALYRGLGFTPHHGYHYRVSEPWRASASEPADSGC